MSRGTLILLVLAVFRLHFWRTHLDAAWNLCSRLEAAPKARLSGYGGGLWGDRVAVLGVRIRGQSFAGRVWGDPALFAAGATFGRRVTVSGRLRCVVPRRNPAAVADGRHAFAGPTLYLTGSRLRVRLEGAPAPWPARLSHAYRDWITRRLAPYPGLRGLAVAVWTGDASGLPQTLRDLYREGGLLHLIALSGQHVGALAGLLALGLKGLGGAAGLARWGWGLRTALWLAGFQGVVAGVWLGVTGFGLPPLQRALAMAFALELVRWRGLHVGATQAVASAAALLLLWDPALAESPGFLLSCAGTWLLQKTRGYLAASLLMPLLMAPLGAFYFGRFSWLSPLYNLALGGLWGLVLIPAGFLLPWLPDLPWAETLWEKGVAVHERVGETLGTGSLVVPRPSPVEVGLLVMGSLALYGMMLHSLISRLFSRKLYSRMVSP